MIRFCFITFTLLFFSIPIFSQQYEFGIGVGGGNYVGDIGREYYFMPNKLGGKIFIKRTINPWFSTRVNLDYFNIHADDLQAQSLGRQSRKIFVNGKVFQYSLGLEYNFIPLNLYLPAKREQRFTPYMYSGIGASSFYGNVYYKNINNKLKFSGVALYIPMNLGVKYRVSRHFLLSVETGAYYYFTDNLDGTVSLYDFSSSQNIKPESTNLNSNDWYTFTSFSLIFTFGDLQCYFNF